eukprot:82130-Hanusia_phi.AAC.2
MYDKAVGNTRSASPALIFASSDGNCRHVEETWQNTLKQFQKERETERSFPRPRLLLPPSPSSSPDSPPLFFLPSWSRLLPHPLLRESWARERELDMKE